MLRHYNGLLEVMGGLFRPTTCANTQASPQTVPIVRTQFVTSQNDIGFASKKAQTISFVERGFERLGLGHRTVVSRGVHTELNRVRLGSLSPRDGLGGSGSWPFFPASSLDCLLFLLY